MKSNCGDSVKTARWQAAVAHDCSGSCAILIGLTMLCGCSRTIARQGGRRHFRDCHRRERRSGLGRNGSGEGDRNRALCRRGRPTRTDSMHSWTCSPGTTTSKSSQTGFTTYRQTGILLDVNSAKVLNIKMKVGQISEKVEVSADAVQIDTASTQNGEVISAQTITAVPLVTRSYTDLLALQPGVTPVSSGLAGGQGGQFSATGFTFNNVSGDLNAGNLSVNGQRESSNGFLLNGTTVQEFAFSGAGIIPNLDSIAEFRIVTNNFDAEYGNYAGGQINVITKSGSEPVSRKRFRVSAQPIIRCHEVFHHAKRRPQAE